MANPTDPQPYAQDPVYTLYRINDLTDQLSLLGPGTQPYWIPQYVFAGSLDVWNILSSDYIDRLLQQPGGPYPWASTAGGGAANLLLFNPAGWGRDLDITIDIDPSLGPINVGWTYLFGTYTGDFSYRQSLYAPCFLPAGAPPIFSFAPNAIPLYSYANVNAGITYPYANAVVSSPGHVEFTLQATADEDDSFQDTDLSGNVHDSGTRNVQIIYLPFNFALTDLRGITGRALTATITVNGGPPTEVSLYRFTRPAWLPVLMDTNVHMDKIGSCDILNGALSQTIQIFECFGPGLADRLDLVYSSERSIFYRDTAKESDKNTLLWQPFGQGWGFTYGTRVVGPLLAKQRFDGTDLTQDSYFVQDAAGRITVFGSTDGINFTPQSSSTWGPQFRRTDSSVTLTKSPGGYTLTAPNADILSFDTDGKLVSIQTPGFSNLLTLDWTGDDFTVTDSSGRTTSYIVDGDGHVATVTDPGGAVWTFGYDGPSLVSITSPQGNFASFGYDSDAFVMTSRTTVTGSQTQYDYYLANVPGCYLWGSLQTATTNDPLRGAIVHTFSYQGGGAQQTVFGNDSSTITYTNPRGNDTSILVSFLPPGLPYYGLSPCLVQFTFSDGGVQPTTYDQDSGHLSFLSTPMGVYTSYSTTEGMPQYIESDNTTVSYAYDPSTWRRLTTYTDENGVTETYDYIDLVGATDLLSHVYRTSINGAPPLTISYQWILPGVMSEESETGGEINLFEYYTAAPFIGLKQHAIHCSGQPEIGEDFFVYDAYGRLTEHTSADGVQIYAYDCFGNITSETHTVGPETHTRTSITTPDWLQTTETDFNGAVSVLNFDPFHSLISASVTDTAGNNSNWAFAYDTVGNKISATEPSGTIIQMQYDNRDRLQLLISPLGSDAYTYDADGHLTSVTQIDSQGQARQTGYALNTAGMPTSLTYPAVPTPDGSGATWNPTVAINYQEDGRIMSISKDVSPGLSGTTSYTQLDEGGRPYAVDRSSAAGSYETIERLDALGQIAQQQGPEFTFASTGTTTSATIMTGEATGTRSSYSYEHDCRGRLINVNDSNSDALINLSYDSGGSDGLMTVNTRDPSATGGVSLRPVMTRTFDSNGRESTITDVRLMTTTLGYDTDGHVSSINVADGRTQQMTYDPIGRPLSIARGAPGIPDLQTIYQYGGNGITQIQHTNILPDGTQQLETYAIGYDTYGRPTSKVDPVQNNFSTTYNDFGDRISVTAGGRTVNYEYDAMRRLIKKTFMDTGEFTNYAYDGLGNLTFAENGVTSQTWQYNELGLLVQRQVIFRSTATPFTKTFTYQYDKFGHFYTRTDDANFKLRYGYDGQDRLISILLNDDTSPAVQFSYTPNNALATRTLVKSGVTTSFLCDTAGEPLSLTHSAASGTSIANVSYVYSQAGQILSVERSGITQSAQFGYDAAGRLATEAIATTGSTDINCVTTYDAIGNRIVRRAVNGSVYGTFDAANECVDLDELALVVLAPATFTISADSSLGPGYDPQNAANGVVTGSLSPGVGWISDNSDTEHVLTFTWQQPQPLAFISVEMPSALGPFQGLIVEVQDPVTQQWSAAPIVGAEGGQYVSGSLNGVGGTLGLNLSPISSIGARIRRPTGEGYTAPPAGHEHVLAIIEMQLEAATVTSTVLSYDGLGSRSQNGGVSYSYDPEGRLLRVNGPNVDLEYLYGADGRLAVRFDFQSNITTYILHEGIHPYCEMDATGNVQQIFLQAPQTSAPVGFYTPADQKYHWFLGDARDSILHVIGDTGAVENSYAYDVWGNPLINNETVPQSLRFCSKRYDSVAEHYFWHMRIYDPQLGVFLQRDPLSASANAYTFLGNDPASQRDPLGLGWLPKWADDALDTVIETAKELPGALYEDFATGAARDRLATFTVAAIDGGKGAVKAAVTGITNTITHPIETVENVAEHVNYVVWHPIDAATETVRGLRTGLSELEKEADHLLELARNDPDKFAEAVGRLTGQAMVNAIVSRATCAVKSFASDAAMKLVKESNVLNKLRNLISAQSKMVRKSGCYTDNWTGEAAKGTFRLPRRDGGAGSVIRPSWPARIKRLVVAEYESRTGLKYSSEIHDICHGVPSALMANSVEKMVNQGVGVEKWLTAAGFPPTPPTTIEKAATMFFRERCTHIGNIIIDDLHENRSKGALSVFGVTSQHVEDWAVQRAEAGWAKGQTYP